MKVVTTYRIGDRVLSENDESWQSSLAWAHKERIRPLCVCRSDGVEMYISRLKKDKFVIKRLPNSGHLHDQSCDSYELPSHLSGRGELEEKAINEDIQSGFTNLHFDFSLSKMVGSRGPMNQSGSTNPVVRSDPKRMTIRALLHCLYEDAGLNKWSPAMQGKRNWYVVRKYLLESSRSKIVKNDPLANVLLIPETFSVDRKDDIFKRRNTFLEKLKPQANSQKLGILIGEVKTIEDARFGYKMTVKHLPEHPIYMGNDVYRRLCKAFPDEMLSIQDEEREFVHVLAICTFQMSAKGSLSIDSISLMQVDRNWIPFESDLEREVVEQLYGRHNYFLKGLRYNLRQEEVIASFLVTPKDKEPIAIYVIPDTADDDYYDRLQKVITESDLESKTIQEEDDLVDLIF